VGKPVSAPHMSIPQGTRVRTSHTGETILSMSSAHRCTGLETLSIQRPSRGECEWEDHNGRPGSQLSIQRPNGNASGGESGSGVIQRDANSGLVCTTH